MGFLKNKKALIVGVANERSIAYGIAKCMHREGAELAFTYPNERFKSRVEEVATEFDSKIVLQCDLASDEQIETAFKDLADSWNGVDIIVHSAAFAPHDQLGGDYLDSVTREGFKIAHDISSYSFAALAKYGRPMMRGRNGALLTLSYLGSIRAVTNYNVMGVAKASLEANMRYMASCLGKDGIRVNAISAGAVKTISAAGGVKNFRKLLALNESIAPLHKNITLEEVGNAAAFLCSDLASGITGDILYVDAGFHIVGIPTDAGEV